MIEQLPCGSCTALCCGPVSITRIRLKQIREHLRSMPAEERKRLQRQKRGGLDCGFLDKENHRCAIYPVRPWVCEVYGRTEGLQCPKLGKLVQIMPAFLVDEGFRREGIIDHVAIDGLVEFRATEVAVGMSTEWSWKKLDFER